MKRLGRISPPRVLGVLALGLILGLLASCAGFSGDRGDEVAKAHYSRHLAYRAQNQVEKAALELELAVKSDPNMYHAYYQMGMIYQALDQKERARAAWERGLEAARQGPERSDYPRAKSIAEMESALASLEPLPALLPPSQPSPAYVPPKPAARSAGSRPAPAKAAKAAKAGGQGYAVLVSSNQKKASAQSDQKRLSALGYKPEITTFQGKKGTWYRVWVGCCGAQEKAQQTAAAVKRKGFPQAVAMKR